MAQQKQRKKRTYDWGCGYGGYINKGRVWKQRKQIDVAKPF